MFVQVKHHPVALDEVADVLSIDENIRAVVAFEETEATTGIVESHGAGDISGLDVLGHPRKPINVIGAQFPASFTCLSQLDQPPSPCITYMVKVTLPLLLLQFMRTAPTGVGSGT